MPTAIVRVKETKQLVGLYAYENRSMLFQLVDQLCSPYYCEFMTVKCGGLHFPKGTPIVERQDWNDKDEYEERIYDGAMICEYLDSRIDDDDWKDFDDKDRGW